MSSDEFEQRAKADLRRIVAGIDPSLRTRIDAMAVAAAAEYRPRPRRRLALALVPLGAVAAIALVAVSVQFFRQQNPASATMAPIPPDDVALLLNVDNLDLLEQMEFYIWLDREPGVLDAAGATAPEPPQRS